MKVHIDVSVFTESEALGLIEGHCTVDELPKVGEAFVLPSDEPEWFAERSGGFEVERVLKEPFPIVMLSDLVLRSRSEVAKLEALIEEADLFFDQYDL